jgi:hypothetical protein
VRFLVVVRVLYDLDLDKTNHGLVDATHNGFVVYETAAGFFEVA